MDESRILIIGAGGQLGKALSSQYPKARTVYRNELDITDRKSVESYDWSGVGVILNGAGFTNVDAAETSKGRMAAWMVNGSAVANLARACSDHNLLLVHISTDYVFDGNAANHIEEEPFSPLSVYGSSKASGDIAASLTPAHYILRTSWVIGDGINFVRTMLDLGLKGVEPTVVTDQIGRLSFTSELVRAIDHLLQKRPAFGVYNCSNGGNPTSWAEITREIYKMSKLPNQVTGITTEQYFKNKPTSAQRPLSSTLDLSKIEGTDFISKSWKDDLQKYIEKELQK